MSILSILCLVSVRLAACRIGSRPAVLVMAVLAGAGLGGLACAEPGTPRAGLLVWGHEVRAFIPCDSEQTLWFRGQAETLDPLVSRYQELTDIPYEPIYVEVKGEAAAPATDGFAADYDSLFTIEAVTLVRATEDGDCRLPR